MPAISCLTEETADSQESQESLKDGMLELIFEPVISLV
jgi:hypothetical protein